MRGVLWVALLGTSSYARAEGVVDVDVGVGVRSSPDHDGNDNPSTGYGATLGIGVGTRISETSIVALRIASTVVHDSHTDTTYSSTFAGPSLKLHGGSGWVGIGAGINIGYGEVLGDGHYIEWRAGPGLDVRAGATIGSIDVSIELMPAIYIGDRSNRRVLAGALVLGHEY